MAAEVEARRNELLGLKLEVQEIQANYKCQAQKRISSQKKMSRMVQTVQERSDDVPLVEDVIIVSLHSETAANESRKEIPEAPIIDTTSQRSGRTKSAEEALAVYASQIDILQRDRVYREAMLETESAIVSIYGQGIQGIVETMKQYCNDEQLTEEVEIIATKQ